MKYSSEKHTRLKIRKFDKYITKEYYSRQKASKLFIYCRKETILFVSTDVLP